MCGIAGMLSGPAASPPNPRDVVARMCARLRHRGPDMNGLAADGPACLGHQRLSIIDLSPEGAQPMTNEDGSVLAVVNGEIYNFEELRRELEASGHRFRSRSDSEVVLHLYEQAGVDFLRRLRGMFALALWDRNSERLILARDPVGKKPLFYYQGRHGLLFASELQGLLASELVPREPDLDAIDAYLSLGYVPAPLSAFRGVQKLPAGHALVSAAGGTPELRRYASLDFGPARRGRPADLVRELETKLEQAVRLRMVADVPVGAFLSGGIDSSLVVAFMARASARPVKTFSVGFPKQDFSELRYARLVAERYATDHQEIVVSPDMVDVVPRLVQHYGEPFADASAVPTWYLCAETRRQVTVALSGDGGDESFAGYDRYQYARLAAWLVRLPGPVRAGVAAALRQVPLPSLRPLRNFGYRLQQTPAGRYEGWVGPFDHRERMAVYSPDLRSRFRDDATEKRFAAILAESTAPDEMGRLLDLDTRTYLPDDILVKVDIASMAHALEVRCPLLDREVMAYAASLATTYKMRGLRSKVLLRALARELLPRAVVTRRKRGFGIPIQRWIREDLAELVRDTLLGRQCRERGLLDARAIEELLAAHARGEPRGSQIWNLMMLELWFRTFIDAQPVYAAALAV
jgi:asparagine synthase (glutamine-hydrolysing)